MCRDNAKVLAEVSSNFIDTIRNIVFKVQKYINIFHYEMRKYYATPNLSCTPENNDGLVLSFIVCESEEILKNKLLKTAVEIKNTMSQKHNNLINKITAMEDDSEFFVTPQLYYYFRDACDISRLNKNRYSKSDIYRDDVIYDVEKSFDEVYNEYTKLEKEDTFYIKTTKGDIIKIIREAFEKVYEVICEFSSHIENSPSVYNSLIIIHEMINYMVLTYFCLSKIATENPEKENSES